MIHKIIIFLLAVLNLIFTTVAVYKGKKNIALAFGILEIVLVFLWFTT